MAQRAGVSFELERLDLEGDELVVAGHWFGVRGLRFVRPTLVADDRCILATLEHKPWAPSVNSTWIAAFPWDRDEIDVGGLALAVGSQVTVPLGDAPLPDEPVRALAPLRQPEPEPEPEPSIRSVDAERVGRLEDELYAVTRERDALLRDRDRALAQLEEAVAAREAAVRTRSRMELSHDEALAQREQALGALAAAQARRDEANAQRDEVLLAYRGLQRHIQAERAQEDRALGDEPDADAGGADPEEPIGVRTMPAARTVMAELQRPTKPFGSKLPFSVFDLWVIRVLGTVAAGCFILLLMSILRVFV